MDFAPLIEKKAGRFQELEAEISSGNLFENPQKAREVMREHARLKELLANWEAFCKARTELAENQELAKGTDAEMAGMARAEIPDLEKKIGETERGIQIALLPPDANEDRDGHRGNPRRHGRQRGRAVRGDLYRMYNRFAETRGLKIEELEASPSELGGLKEVIFRVSGTAVFRQMRYESGVHRVQRVPAPRRRGASTRPRRPWQCCPRRRKSILN